jgi:Putative restriction endonuclease
LGVERKKGGKSRRSYATWEENYVVPILTLEMVSHTPGGEYDEKLSIYEKLGVLYYVIYNPEFWLRDQHQPFEVYKLVDNKYQLQIGEPYWMPEVGLGIGRHQGIIAGIPQELLCWYNQIGIRYLTSDEIAQSEKQQRELAEQQRELAEQEAEIERQQRERLAAKLRELGIDPDNI